ncbi:hypothetical protein ACFL23_04935, partial [Patescibacteria group bacterium]
MSAEIDLLPKSNKKKQIETNKKVVLEKGGEDNQNFVAPKKNDDNEVFKKTSKISFKGIISRFKKKRSSDEIDNKSKKIELDNSVKGDVNFITSDLII